MYIFCIYFKYKKYKSTDINRNKQILDLNILFNHGTKLNLKKKTRISCLSIERLNVLFYIG